MRLRLQIELDRVYFEKVVDWPALPRVGDIIELTEGGWSEEVRQVWWDATESDGGPKVYMGQKHDTYSENLNGSLRESGWTAPYDSPTNQKESAE